MYGRRKKAGGVEEMPQGFRNICSRLQYRLRSAPDRRVHLSHKDEKPAWKEAITALER